MGRCRLRAGLGGRRRGRLGSACRYGLDQLITARFGDRLPWGTLVVDVSGSFGVGFVGGLSATRVLSAELTLVIAAGFLGAHTTCSTAMYGTLYLWDRDRRLAATVNLVAPLALATVAAALG